jgi:hypothetical protein
LEDKKNGRLRVAVFYVAQRAEYGYRMLAEDIVADDLTDAFGVDPIE